MFFKLAVLAALAAAIGAGGHRGGESYINYHLHAGHAVPVEFKDKHGHKDVDYYAHPEYKFEYGVKDEHTHDHKSQHEHRDGDKVEGGYKVKEADGTLRTVKYVADKKGGFNAEVHRTGHAQHPAVYGHDSGHGHEGGGGHDDGHGHH